MMTQRYGTDQGWMLEGVPVIDGTLVAFKVAEMMVDLVALGLSAGQPVWVLGPAAGRGDQGTQAVV